jgi:diketogulonate reductase-like aldo/keto reductase
MSVPLLALSDKNKIPQVGLGLWKVKDQEQFNTGFAAAVEAGYTHFDTAQAYDNEHYLGEAWRSRGLKRQDIFITTKIKVSNFGKRHVQSGFQESLKNLQTDYVDLLLLHFPVTLLRKKAWLELEKIQASGGAKSIGVSNYTIRHLKEMKDYANLTPSVNQVELHLFLQQPELIDYCREHGILVEAYSPLAHAKEMDEPVIKKVADKHGKSYAQVMLRWLVEQGLVVLPKSVTPSRVKENIDIFDFELDAEDKAALSKLDRDMRTCWSPVHIP